MTVFQSYLRFTERTLHYRSDNYTKKRRVPLPVKGRGPKASSCITRTNQRQWVSGGTCHLTERDYVHCDKVRAGSLPMIASATRGRYGDSLSRYGCLVPESNSHGLQFCYRMQGIRIKKQNTMAIYISRDLRCQGFTVKEELYYRPMEGLRKPSIAPRMGRFGVIINVLVVGQQSDLKRARRKDIRK